MKTPMITRLLSILLLISLSTIASTLKTHKSDSRNAYFIIRSEWDDRCVAYMNNDLILDANCKLAQSVWESTKGQINNVALKNYYGGKYLNFIAKNPVPQMISEPTGNSRFNFQVVHPKNRRWPNNRSYWGVTYHVIRNSVTGLCLMVSGNVMRQLNCNPSLPEHLSFEQVSFDPSWKKSPERVADEIAKIAPPVIPAPVKPAPVKPVPVIAAPVIPAPVIPVLPVMPLPVLPVPTLPVLPVPTLPVLPVPTLPTQQVPLVRRKCIR